MIGETTFPMQKILNYLGNNHTHEQRNAIENESSNTYLKVLGKQHFQCKNFKLSWK